MKQHQRERCLRCERNVRKSTLIDHISGFRVCVSCNESVAWALSGITETVGGRDDYYRRTYGITARDYRARFVEQLGLCAVCQRPQEGLSAPMVVDHNHGTGEVRGLLCATCNTGIGLLGDSPAVLLSALSYLTERGSTSRARWAAAEPTSPGAREPGEPVVGNRNAARRIRRNLRRRNAA